MLGFRYWSFQPMTGLKTQVIDNSRLSIEHWTLKTTVELHVNMGDKLH